MSKITEVTLALFGKQSGHNRREGDKLYQQALVSHLYPLRSRQHMGVKNTFVGGGKFLGNIKSILPIKTTPELTGTIRQVLFEIDNQPLDLGTLNAIVSFNLEHEGIVEHDVTVDSDLGTLTSDVTFSLEHAEVMFVTLNSDDEKANLAVTATLNILVE